MARPTTALTHHKTTDTTTRHDWNAAEMRHADAIGLAARATLTVAVATGCVLASPVAAHAKTISELDDAIAGIESSIGTKEQAVSDAQAALSETIKSNYKGNSNRAMLYVLMDSNGLEAMVANEQYAKSVNRKYLRTIENANTAMSELRDAKATLEVLRAEKVAQQEARKNADVYHYCQWGEPYSDIRYFCGTIGSAGCGLCAYTSAINILKGTDYSPDTMLAIRGDWVGTEEYVDSTVGSPNGLNHADWTKDRFDVTMESLPAQVGTARDVLSDNEAVIIICSGGTVFHDKAGSWRWSGGHYVIAYRCDGNGFYVHDSSYQGDNGTAVYYTDGEMQGMLTAAGQMTVLHN